MAIRGPFRRLPDGAVGVSLRPWERAMLATLPLQLRELLASDDPGLRRLFPVAYHQNPEQEAEFQRLMRDELMAKRIATAELLAASAEAKRIEADEVNRWLSALNDLRLVLGTQLDVSEDHELDLGDPDDEENPVVVQYEVYLWLGFLQDRLLAATDDPETDLDALDGLDLDHPDLAELSSIDPEDFDPEDFATDNAAPGDVASEGLEPDVIGPDDPRRDAL